MGMISMKRTLSGSTSFYATDNKMYLRRDKIDDRYIVTFVYNSTVVNIAAML